jgi:hypothetical protein
MGPTPRERKARRGADRAAFSLGVGGIPLASEKTND